MQAAVVCLVLAASGVSGALVLFPHQHVSSRFCQLRSVLFTSLWLGALPCFRRVVLPLAHGHRHELIRIPRSFVGHAAWWSLLYIRIPQWLLGFAILDGVRSYNMNLGSFTMCSSFVVVYYCCFAVLHFEQLPQLPCFSAGHWHCLPHHAREQPVVSDVPATPLVFQGTARALGFYQGHFQPYAYYWTFYWCLL